MDPFIALPAPPLFPCSAFVSYAGPFTSRFRAGLIAEWIKFLADKKVPMTPGIKGKPLVPGHAGNRPPVPRLAGV